MVLVVFRGQQVFLILKILGVLITDPFFGKIRKIIRLRICLNHELDSAGNNLSVYYIARKQLIRLLHDQLNGFGCFFEGNRFSYFENFGCSYNRPVF